jgi:hypothetical protein
MRNYIILLLLFCLPISSIADSRSVELFQEVESELKEVGVVLKDPCEKGKKTQSQKSTVEDINGKPIAISLITKQRAKELFDEMASQKHIPFNYPQDGCYARAHEMSRLLEKQGIITTKVFIEGDLRVDTKNSPSGYVEWWYHVAPIVKVQDGSKEELYVFDPSIFDRPVPLKEWVQIQTKHSPGQNEMVYHTKRFNYTPNQRYDDLSSFRGEDLLDSQQVMQRYSAVVKARQTPTKK